jgi:hypothetical protein
MYGLSYGSATFNPPTHPSALNPKRKSKLWIYIFLNLFCMKMTCVMQFLKSAGVYKRAWYVLFGWWTKKNNSTMKWDGIKYVWCICLVCTCIIHLKIKYTVFFNRTICDIVCLIYCATMTISVKFEEVLNLMLPIFDSECKEMCILFTLFTWNKILFKTL